MYIPIVHHICDEAAGYWIRDQVRHVELDYSRVITLYLRKPKTKQNNTNHEKKV